MSPNSLGAHPWRRKNARVSAGAGGGCVRGEVKALSDLAALGEGSTVEFKRSLRSDLGREICAFANAAGGVILLGVDDDGAVRGVEGHNRLKSQVQSVARSADPSISVEIESMGDVLAVRVPAQRGKPYSFGGKFFMRDGASSQQMSRDEIREFWPTWIS